MSADVFYKWERDTYPEFRAWEISRDDAEPYVVKLIRHFKTPKVGLRASYRRGGAGVYKCAGDSSTWLPVICSGKPTNMGTVIHEFSHHLSRFKHGKLKRCHGKLFKRELKRCYTWAKRWLPKEEPSCKSSSE